MKKSKFALVLAALSLWLAVAPAFAQQIQGLPRASQQQVVTQTLGVAEVSIVYHRPLVNGRKIWGGLVPYDTVWRAGANDNTTISFSDPVKIEGEDLAAGTYALHMLPGEDEWQIIFSTNHTSWGSFSYDESEDALRVKVTSEAAPFQEVLEYRFDHLTPDGGVIVLHWEELAVPFEIEVDTHALSLAKIRRDLRSLPGFAWQGWNSAANFCAQNNINQEEAMEWIDRALSMEENFANLRVKAQLLEQTGKTDEALELAAKLVELANEPQTNVLGYQSMQRGDVEKAIEIFAKNTRDYPESWNVWDSLGEAQANKGMTAEAITNYTKALEMAPENQHARIRETVEGLESQ
ncbi:MAG: DUF2911 domain-containing protein [Thermoanaerobaculia bacterium]